MSDNAFADRYLDLTSSRAYTATYDPSDTNASRQQTILPYDQYRDSRVMENRKQVIFDLVSVAKRARDEDWDGYQASAMSQATVELTVHFISEIPPVIPDPDIDADPDGDVSIEWFPRDSDKELVVNLNGSGRLVYFTKIDGKRQSNTLYYDGSIPSELLKVMARVLL